MGLVIQRIEPNGRVYRDGRLKAGDRIIEINQTSLIGVDFVKAQEILRDALKHSPHLSLDEEDDENEDTESRLNQMSTHTGELNLKVVRNNQLDVKTVEYAVNGGSDQQIPTRGSHFEDEEFAGDEFLLNDFCATNSGAHFNERPVEIEFDDKENNLNANSGLKQPTSVNDEQKSHQTATLSSYSSINMSALNTKKLGKKVTVQLIKGPQGLGFKLAARDNCTPGEYSPIYIKNILPKGAAITDGRLQRGDRLLKVDFEEI